MAPFFCGLFLQWNSLPELPDELGVAGPFVGVQIKGN